MKYLFQLLILVVLSIAAPAKPPNILLILADDLGFSDLGCYGGEISTPNLDKLAAGGLRFTQFYNTARCWPSRAALLTGYYAQQVRRDTLPGIPSGGRGKRQGWATLLPRKLQPLGYRSYHVGKWHLDGMPVANGFDRSYYLKDQGRFFNPQTHWLNDSKLPPVEKNSGFYATSVLADYAIGFLKEHALKHTDKPFFHYLAFAAPHFPLHALPGDIAKYQGSYDEGWAKIRGQRWGRIKSGGLLAGRLSKVERDLGPPYHFPEHLKILGPGEVNRPKPWAQLSAGQKKFQAVKMEIHAAMIDRMDQEIGRVLAQIEAMGQLRDTLVIFLSDNGASAEIMVRDDGHDPQASPGSAATYLCLGPGWSTSCNTPLRRHKTWVHEGGISTPLILSWPRGIAARGELRHSAGHIIDLAPTILELAGVVAADLPGGVPFPPGRSLVPLFKGEQPDRHDFLWWFHDGHRALRVENWKLVAAKGEPWELYNLDGDRSESVDLCKEEPEKTGKLAQLWQEKMTQFRETAQLDLPKKVRRR
ncbi:MAG: arylsulfatase [Verrucomicrobiales bacterium]